MPLIILTHLCQTENVYPRIYLCLINQTLIFNIHYTEYCIQDMHMQQNANRKDPIHLAIV